MYDLAVIGLGPGGLEAVKLALKNNLSVIAFDSNIPGGTCLNKGCIPTKSIVHTAKLLNEINEQKGLSVLSGEIGFDWKKIIERKNQIVDTFVKSLNLFLNKTENLKYINAEAEIFIEDEYVTIQADYNVYKAKNIIIATGSKPRELPGLEFDNKFIISSDDIFNFDKLPKSIAIVGSGAIGVEWSYILSSFGVEVYLIEKEANILPLMDKDIQKTAERLLKSKKINIIKNDYISSAQNGEVTLNSGKKFETECVLVAVGRTVVLPNVTYPGIEGNFIIKPNNDCTTDFDNIFVIGDALSDVMLAHNASYQALKVINLISGKQTKKYPLPSVVYISPEIASMGIREQDTDDSYFVKKVSLTSLQKAWCDCSTVGFLKLITKDNLIVGCHIVSNEASSLISVFSQIMGANISIEDVKNNIYPHPSYSELIKGALSVE